MYDATKLPASSTEQVSLARGGEVASLNIDVSDEPITLDEAKKQCRVELPDDDDYIASLITVARQMAESRLNRTIVQRQLEARFDTWTNGMRLPKPPLVSVDEISYIGSDGVSTVLDADSYAVSHSIEPAHVSLAYGASWPSLLNQPQSIVVRYTAGYPEGEVPAPIIQWMKLVIGSLYDNRESMSAGVQVYSLPDDFMKWFLQPYMVYE